MGYTHQKLFANNYICYHKKMPNRGDFTIWCWKAGHEIEVNDFGGYTKKVVEFLLNNIPEEGTKHYSLGKCNFSVEAKIHIAIHRETGEVSIAKDLKDFYNKETKEVDHDACTDYHREYSVRDALTRSDILWIKAELEALGVKL